MLYLSIFYNAANSPPSSAIRLFMGSRTIKSLDKDVTYFRTACWLLSVCTKWGLAADRTFFFSSTQGNVSLVPGRHLWGIGETDQHHHTTPVQERGSLLLAGLVRRMTWARVGRRCTSLRALLRGGGRDVTYPGTHSRQCRACCTRVGLTIPTIWVPGVPGRRGGPCTPYACRMYGSVAGNGKCEIYHDEFRRSGDRAPCRRPAADR